MRQWFFSRHALERMEDMGVKRQEVLDLLAHPETDYRAPVVNGHPPGRRLARTGNLTVCYDPNGDCVVTVLWNTPDPITRDEPVPQAVRRRR